MLRSPVLGADPMQQLQAMLNIQHTSNRLRVDCPCSKNSPSVCRARNLLDGSIRAAGEHWQQDLGSFRLLYRNDEAMRLNE